MGIVDRIKTIAGAKAEKALDAMEDPSDAIEYAYKKLLDLQIKTKQSLVTVLQSGHELEIQMKRLEVRKAEQEEKVSKLLAQGNEEMARKYAENVAGVDAQIKKLAETQAQVKTQEEAIREAVDRLQVKVDNVKFQKESIKAQAQTAEATSKIAESLTGIKDDADIGAIVNRATEKIDKLNARSQAINQLAAEGILNDVTGNDEPASKEEVDAIITRLK